MKKYLFDKIEVVSEGVKFISFRKPSIFESLQGIVCTSFSKDEWEYFAFTFKGFLKMLSKTKLNDNYEYDITVPLPVNNEPISFDLLLKNFVADVYNSKSPNKDVLAKFYSKAYQIKEEAKRDKEILDKEPNEFLNNKF